MDILVIGGSGLLGREITGQAKHRGRQVAATFHSHAPAITGVDWSALDIRRRGEVAALVERIRPAVVVNAAYRQGDWATTADGAMHVAAAAAAVGARLVHVSSDALFGGRARGYDETCPPDPITPYGAAKAAAETAVKGLDPAAVIARTSLIIGDDGSSPQERYVHGLASGTTTGVLFTDEVRCPVHVRDLASALLELAGSGYSGIHHVAGVDAVTRHELGVLIARRDGLDETGLRTGLRARTGPPAPIEVRLDCTMTQSRLTTRLRGAREFLAPAVRPPETVDAGEVVLRRWRPEWVGAATAAVLESLPELRPYLPWARDGYDTDATRGFIGMSVEKWADGTEFNYAIFNRAGDLVGAIGLMTRMGPGVLEIGYWTRTAFTGRGHMTAAVDALAGVALALPGIERVAIRHDVTNAASAAVAAKAGFTEVRRVEREPEAPAETGTDVIRERHREA